MEELKDILAKLRKAREHFQEKTFLSDNEESKVFYKGKASGLQLAIEHVQKSLYEQQDIWETVIDKMYEEWSQR